ncbi:MAG TPA: O-antigen ligase family protein [Pyrinomonadaceae bacterium]|nr:O-antigen ligase family protein [Acidobacteriota bacterium]HQZ97503.1 O-antigen ligase family protein [Pyrinomonadaceae bacterium]
MSRLNKIAYFLICAVGILTTLAYGTVHQPVIALFYLVTAALALILIADAVFSGVMKVSRTRLQIPLILLGVYALIQVVPFGSLTAPAAVSGTSRTLSIEPFATRVVALHIFALSTFFLVALSVLDSAARVRRFVSVLTIFGFGYAFFAILQSVLSPDKIFGIYQPAAGVPFGSFVNRHDFAAIIEMTIALPLGLIFAGSLRSDKRLLYIVAIALMGAALLLSGSRGGLVALIAEIILLIILTSKAQGTKNLVLKAALSLALIFAAVAGAVFVGGDTSLTRFSETAASDDVTSSRSQIWSVTLKVIASNLPFGAGLGAFPQAYTAYDPSGGYERVEQSHNDYLQIVADAGLVGAVIGGLFLFWFFREGIRNAAVSNQFRRGTAVGAFAGCFAILVHSLFDFVLHITAVSVMFLTLMSILVASGRDYDDDVDEYDTPKSKRRRSASVTPIQQKLRD